MNFYTFDKFLSLWSSVIAVKDTVFCDLHIFGIKFHVSYLGTPLSL